MELYAKQWTTKITDFLTARFKKVNMQENFEILQEDFVDNSFTSKMFNRISKYILNDTDYTSIAKASAAEDIH